jgi:RNA methyltransferase, TrmH family
MITKQEQKYVQSLHIKKYRTESKRFLVEGLKNILELSNSDYQIEHIYASPKAVDVFQQKFPKADIKVDHPDKISQLSTFKTNETGLAVVHQKTDRLLELSASKFLILDGISDPGNLGTIIRLADWYGLDQVVCSEDCCEFYNPKTIAASMGSFSRVSAHYTDLKLFLKSIDMPVWGAFLEGSSNKEIKTSSHFALVLGSESHGIRPEIAPFINHKVTIPRKGKAESLNAAVACAILMDTFF